MLLGLAKKNQPGAWREKIQGFNSLLSIKQLLLFQLLPHPNLDLSPTSNGIWYCQFLNSSQEELVWFSALLVTGLDFRIFLSANSLSLIPVLYSSQNCFCCALLSCSPHLPLYGCLQGRRIPLQQVLYSLGVFNPPSFRRFVQDYRVSSVRPEALSYLFLCPPSPTHMPDKEQELI